MNTNPIITVIPGSEAEVLYADDPNYEFIEFDYDEDHNIQGIKFRLIQDLETQYLEDLS